MAYTPSPWQVVQPSSEHPSRAMVCGRTGSDIYDAPLTNETEANARLIAVAPEMLETLQWLVAMHARRERGTNLDTAISTARTLIAKVKG